MTVDSLIFEQKKPAAKLHLSLLEIFETKSTSPCIYKEEAQKIQP